MRYEGYSGVHQMPLEDFIRWGCRDDDYRGPHHQMTFVDPMVVKLVEMLVRTNRLTIEEMESILPHKNYRMIISLDEDWI